MVTNWNEGRVLGKRDFSESPRLQLLRQPSFFQSNLQLKSKEDEGGEREEEKSGDGVCWGVV